MLTSLNKIYLILNTRIKITFLFFIFFSLILSFLETISIAFIPIFLTFVAGLKNEMIVKFDSLFNNSNVKSYDFREYKDISINFFNSSMFKLLMKFNFLIKIQSS